MMLSVINSLLVTLQSGQMFDVLLPKHSTDCDVFPPRATGLPEYRLHRNGIRHPASVIGNALPLARTKPDQGVILWALAEVRWVRVPCSSGTSRHVGFMPTSDIVRLV
jgi:hypothetical protein